MSQSWSLMSRSCQPTLEMPCTEFHSFLLTVPPTPHLLPAPLLSFSPLPSFLPLSSFFLFPLLPSLLSSLSFFSINKCQGPCYFEC